MKKVNRLRACLLVTASMGILQVSAQWTTPAAAVITTTNSVGIGNAAPIAPLDVVRNPALGNGTAVFRGSQYISHFSYGAAEHTYIRGGKAGAAVYINDVGGGAVSLGSATSAVRVGGTLTIGGSLLIPTASTEYVKIGSVGTPNIPGYKLYVDQGILTEKVKVAVANSANWADYVFAKEYKLMPLTEVEQFVNENKHLPNVPSAADMIKEGNDLGKTDAKLLEKIEELTLYLIEMKKANEQLAKTVENQNKKIELLESKIK